MRSVAWAAAVIGALASAAAAEPKADKTRADKLFDDGRKYLATKEYALACTAFEQSQAADPAIGTQLNIALCYEQWGHVAAAYRAYVEAERVAAAKKDDRAKGAHKKVDELGPKVPRVTLALPPDADASASVSLDGTEVPHDQLGTAQLVEVGTHQVEGRVVGKPARVTPFEVAAGQALLVVVLVPKPDVVVVVAPPVLAPPPPPPPSRSPGKLYGGLALTGVGAVAIGVAAAVGLGARGDYGNAIASCPMLQCTTTAAFDATHDARSRANAMTFVAGGGIALAAVGVYLIATSRGQAAPETRAALAPLVGPGVVGLAFGGPL